MWDSLKLLWDPTYTKQHRTCQQLVHVGMNLEKTLNYFCSFFFGNEHILSWLFTFYYYNLWRGENTVLLNLLMNIRSVTFKQNYYALSTSKYIGSIHPPIVFCHSPTPAFNRGLLKSSFPQPLTKRIFKKILPLPFNLRIAKFSPFSISVSFSSFVLKTSVELWYLSPPALTEQGGRDCSSISVQ